MFFLNTSVPSRLIIHLISGMFLPLFVFLFLFIGGYKALQNTHTQALYTENRYPEKITQLQSLSEFVNRDYQKQIEKALSDQIPANQYVKKSYYGVTNRALLKIFNHMFSFKNFLHLNTAVVLQEVFGTPRHLFRVYSFPITCMLVVPSS